LTVLQLQGKKFLWFNLMDCRVQFNEFQARFAIAYRDRLTEHNDLLREAREGARTLEATEKRLARMAAAEGYPVDWGGVPFTKLLHGKSGPHGGLEATLANVGFYLVCYLVDASPRKLAASRALDMWFAASRTTKVCRWTKERFFGPALVALLGDRKLREQAIDIGVASDRGAAYFDYVYEDQRVERVLFATPEYETSPPGRYTTMHLYPPLVGPVIDLLQPTSRARRAARRAKMIA
jgi:hypothetical protein